MSTITTTDLSTLAAKINDEHAACEGSARAALGHAITAGVMLLEAKAALPHGERSPWLAAHFDASERTAQAYMRLAQHRARLSDPQRVAGLSVRGALRLLAAPRPLRSPDEIPDDHVFRPDAPLMPMSAAEIRELRDYLGLRGGVAEGTVCGAWTEHQREGYRLHLEILLNGGLDAEESARAMAIMRDCPVQKMRDLIARLDAKAARLIRLDPFAEGSGRTPDGWDFPRLKRINALPCSTADECNTKARALAAFWEWDDDRVPVVAQRLAARSA